MLGWNKGEMRTNGDKKQCFTIARTTAPSLENTQIKHEEWKTRKDVRDQLQDNVRLMNEMSRDLVLMRHAAVRRFH